MTSYFRNGCSDLYEIRQTDAEKHAVCGIKPDVKFQYGGRLFFETGSNYISAVNLAMSTKFGFMIDFDLLKTVTLANVKPEVVFSGCGRHLDKWI